MSDTALQLRPDETAPVAKTEAVPQSLLPAIIQAAKDRRSAGKLIFIGNGGSATIASHMAIDFLKNALLMVRTAVYHLRCRMIRNQ